MTNSFEQQKGESTEASSVEQKKRSTISKSFWTPETLKQSGLPPKALEQRLESLPDVPTHLREAEDAFKSGGDWNTPLAIAILGAFQWDSGNNTSDDIMTVKTPEGKDYIIPSPGFNRAARMPEVYIFRRKEGGRPKQQGEPATPEEILDVIHALTEEWKMQSVPERSAE